MSAEPLLGADKSRGLLAGGYFGGSGAGCRSSLAHWWTTTTAREYLSSPISRRHLLKYYGIVAVAGTLSDIVGYRFYFGWTPEVSYWHRYIGDASEIVLSLLLWAFPVGTLKADWAVVACLLLQFEMYLLMLPPDEHTTVPLCLAAEVILCHAFGIHSLFVIAFVCLSLLTVNLHQEVSLPSGILGQLTFTVGMTTVVMTYFEWMLAYHFGELREQLAAIQTLLDKAVDGYCTVDRKTGRVTHISHGFAHVFGADISGARILDFVDPSDRSKVMKLYDASRCDVTEPVLATFTRRLSDGSGAAEFEGQLVPYRITETDVNISFQLVGEVRMGRHLADGAEQPQDLGQPGPALEEHQNSDREDNDAGSSSPTRKDAARAQAKDAGEAAVPQSMGPRGRKPNKSTQAETIELLQISFDAGDPNFLIGDSSLSRELLPRQGQLIKWFPHHARSRIDKWVAESVNHCDENGFCRKALENFELVLPPTPMIKITASKAFLQAEQHEVLDDGSMSLPCVLCLRSAEISRFLSAIPEELNAEDREDDDLTLEGSEGVCPSDSASMVMMKFREVANQSPPESSASSSASSPPS